MMAASAQTPTIHTAAMDKSSIGGHRVGLSRTTGRIVPSLVPSTDASPSLTDLGVTADRVG